MKLNFRKIGSGHPLFILHGVFGSSDNWTTVGKELSKNYTVYLIDQRNHGQSPHDDEMDYKLMSGDVKELVDDEGLGAIYLIGHSMGGKTAMYFATGFPRLTSKLVVVDIAPKYYPPHHQEIFSAYRSVNLSALKSRKDADCQLAGMIENFGIRQFMLKNLNRDSNNQFSWKINLNAIEANIDRMSGGLPENARFGNPALFIGGKKSDYIMPGDESIIQKHFSDFRVEMIDGAGHWVHAEKPRELLEIVEKFLVR